jgi:ABC-type branched-subunit amino acid transport system substrate-binding protein
MVICTTMCCVQGVALARLCLQFNWHRVAVMATNSVYATTLIQAFVTEALRLNIEIIISLTVDTGDPTPQLTLLQQSGARIIVFAGESNVVDIVAPAALMMGLMNNPIYQWIATDSWIQ